MKATVLKNKKTFVSPKAELVVLDAMDMIATSGGFAGEWDTNLPPVGIP